MLRRTGHPRRPSPGSRAGSTPPRGRLRRPHSTGFRTPPRIRTGRHHRRSRGNRLHTAHIPLRTYHLHTPFQHTAAGNTPLRSTLPVAHNTGHCMSRLPSRRMRGPRTQARMNHTVRTHLHSHRPRIPFLRNPACSTGSHGKPGQQDNTCRHIAPPKGRRSHPPCTRAWVRRTGRTLRHIRHLRTPCPGRMERSICSLDRRAQLPGIVRILLRNRRPRTLFQHTRARRESLPFHRQFDHFRADLRSHHGTCRTAHLASQTRPPCSLRRYTKQAETGWTRTMQFGR